MMLLWLVFLALLIAGAFWFAKREPSFPRIGKRSTALDVLEERYARGDISRDEYLQKKSDLQELKQS